MSLAGLASVRTFPRLGALTCCAAALFACALSARAGTARPEPQPAQPELSDEDLDTLQALFRSMSEAFVNGDAKAIKGLMADSDERDTIVETLKREFKEVQYLDFQVERPIPDNRISTNRHSVDVTIRLKLLHRDDARPPDMRKPIENTTFQSFIVERGPRGGFRIVNSSFFDNMGRRNGGVGMFVDILVAFMLLCAMLGFWAWMGFEAWWIRPRSSLWRTVVMIPCIGPAVFFCVRYLPGKWTQKISDNRP